MFTKWEKGMLADLVHDEITRLNDSPYRGDEGVVADLWKIYEKLEEMD